MLVSQILKLKADDYVVTVTPDATVAQAATSLSSRKIGSLVVSGDGKKALGILSERDIVREIGKRGPQCLKDRVDSMMTRKLETCRLGDRADDIMARMTEGRFRHMPVLEQGDMVGIITLGDVVKARLRELSMENHALEGMIMGH